MNPTLECCYATRIRQLEEEVRELRRLSRQQQRTIIKLINKQLTTRRKWQDHS